MRYFIFFILLSFAGSAQAQDQCKDLLSEFASVNQQIADIEAERALTEEFRDMIEAMNTAIDDLNDSKGDAEAYEEKLGEFEDLLGEKFEQVSEVVKGTKAGTEKLKEALGETADGVEKAQLAFRLYLEKRKVGDNTNPAESLQTLADSYEFLRSSLGPLIKQIPVIGQFLEAYGEALKSAAGVATKLQNIRNDQAAAIDQFPELAGGNPFRFPTAKDNRLKELTAKQEALEAQIDELDCSEPEPEEPEEVKQADAAARNACIVKLGLSGDPDTAYFEAIRRKDQAVKAYRAALSRNDSAPGNVTKARDAIVKAEGDVKATEVQLKNSRVLFEAQQGAADLISRVRRQVPGFPGDPGDRGCLVASGIAADGPGERRSGFSATLREKLASYCDAYRFLPEQKEKLETAREALAAAEQELGAAKAAFKKAEDELLAARKAIKAAQADRERLADCIEEQSGPIDISGRYWHRESGAVLIVRRHGPNYQFYYEEVPARLQNEVGVKQGDDLFIGRLKDGKLEGIYRNRFPVKVRTEWGCTNARTTTGKMEGLIWASGEWLSLTPDNFRIDGNCKITKTTSVETFYKEGTKYYNTFYRAP